MKIFRPTAKVAIMKSIQITMESFRALDVLFRQSIIVGRETGRIWAEYYGARDLWYLGRILWDKRLVVFRQNILGQETLGIWAEYCGARVVVFGQNILGQETGGNWAEHYGVGAHGLKCLGLNIWGWCLKGS